MEKIRRPLYDVLYNTHTYAIMHIIKDIDITYIYTHTTYIYGIYNFPTKTNNNNHKTRTNTYPLVN